MKPPAILWGVKTVPLALTLPSCGSFVFVDEASENCPAMDPFHGEVGHGMVRARWAQLAASVGSSPVVVARVIG